LIQINEDSGAAPPRFRDEGLDDEFAHGTAFASAHRPFGRSGSIL